MYITDNVYLIHTRKREKKKRNNTQYRWRESIWTKLICAIESLYRSRFFEARRKRDIKRPKNITFEEIYPDGNRGNRLYSPVIYHFLSTRIQPRPQQCGIIYIYKRHRSLFKAKRRKKSRTKRESLFAKRSSARLLRNETPKKRGKFVWRRNEKGEKNCLIVRLIEETSSQIESS